MKKILIAVIFLCIMLLPTAVGSGAEAAPSPVTITILHTNDTHASSSAAGVGMMARLSSYIQTTRQRVGAENVLVLDGGDFSGVHRCANDDGFLIDEMFKYIGYNGIALGNHDFYCPIADVVARRKVAGSVAFFAAQLAYKESDGSCGWRPYLDAYRVYTMGPQENPVRVAVMGIANFGAPPTKTLCQRPALDALRYSYDQAKAQGAQAFIVITHHPLHDQIPPPYGNGAAVIAEAMAAEGRPLALVIGGHDHRLKQSAAGGALLAEAGEYGEHIGIATLTINPATGAVSARWSSKKFSAADPLDPGLLALFGKAWQPSWFESRHILP